MNPTTALTVAPPTDLARPDPPWLDRELYPFPTRTFATAHGDLSYVDVGRGPVVLLVHGTPSWSFEWRHVIRRLSRDHRVIAPDHLGFGLSDKPEGAPLAPADHAERLRALVTNLGLREVTLVVHDFGCPIGLPLALAGDGVVGRVVVANGWMWSNEDDRDVVRVDRFVRGWLGRLLYLRLNASPRWLLPSMFGKAFRLERQVHRHYTAPFPSRAERAAPYALACALAGSNDFYAGLWARRDALAKVPLSIVWGDRDPAFGAKHLERWVSAFPHAGVTRLAEIGHFPAEEAPDAVVAATRGAR